MLFSVKKIAPELRLLLISCDRDLSNSYQTNIYSIVLASFNAAYLWLSIGLVDHYFSSQVRRTISYNPHLATRLILEINCSVL